MVNVASSFCYVIAHLYVAIYGFLKGERASARESEILPSVP